MGFRASGLAAVWAVCLLAAVTAGCGSVTASSSAAGTQPAAAGTQSSAVHASASATATRQSPAPGAVSTGTAAPPGCQYVPGALTLASNGKTYCVRVGEKFSVFLRGTLASRWLVPVASSGVLKGVPNGAMSLVAGLTGASFAGVRPGRVFISSIRPPCAGVAAQKNKLEPAFGLPTPYPLHACAPQRRFSVTLFVVT